MSKSVKEVKNVETERVDTPDVTEEASKSIVIPHVMFTEADIVSVLTLLNGISVSGTDNILKFADAYKILSSNGRSIPVSVNTP